MCGSQNCPSSLGFDSFVDCCYIPENGDQNYCTAIHHCGIDEGDCDSNDECQSGLRCGSNNCLISLGFDNETDCCYNIEDFCTTIDPCGIDEGDCDSHDECQGGLGCGSNNCPISLGFENEVDCCLNIEDFCTTVDPCGTDEGDCDSHDECQNNLVCGNNNCPALGSVVDCCQGM